MPLVVVEDPEDEDKSGLLEAEDELSGPGDELDAVIVLGRKAGAGLGGSSALAGTISRPLFDSPLDVDVEVDGAGRESMALVGGCVALGKDCVA